MKKRGQLTIWIILGIFLVAAVVGTFYLWGKSQRIEMQSECDIDADCLPTSCSGAVDCIAKADAPDCSGIPPIGPTVNCACENGVCAKK